MARQFVDFGRSWNMRIPVPYAALVRDGDRAWATGQLALDEAGQVLAPDDLMAQAAIILDYIDDTLSTGALERDDVSRLVLYCAEHAAARRDEVKALFVEAFPHRPLIEMVSVPHFYYDGILLEVDVFCAPSEPMVEEDLPGGGKLRFVREADMELFNLSAPADTLGQALGAAMSRHSLSPERLLSGWGVSPEPALESIPAQVAPRLPGFFSGALMPCFLGDDLAHLYLTFARAPIQLIERRESRVRLHLARTADLAYLDARYLGASGGEAASLAKQTEVVMDGLARLLDEAGLTFRDVVKSTAFYAGADNPEALHANLAVRNRYYNTPGPASTGVPIARMADLGSKVRVELIAKPRS